MVQLLREEAQQAQGEQRSAWLSLIKVEVCFLIMRTKAQGPDDTTSPCGGYYGGDEVSWDVVSHEDRGGGLDGGDATQSI